MTFITANAVPTGGAITLNITASGMMTLSRSVSGINGFGPYVPLYTGPAVPFYVDAGDLLPGPLSPNNFYAYRVTDTVGTVDSVPLQPILEFNPQIEPLTALLIRMLQGAINVLAVPYGVSKVQVLQAMPIEGLPPLPMIVVNLDVIQQEQIPIGQQVPIYQDLGNGTITATIASYAKRIFKISILTDNAVERDFYRDMLPGFLEVFAVSVLAPTGLNNEHRYQLASGQVAKDQIGKAPGFYFADVMLEFSGQLNITVNAQYGLIEHIDFKAIHPDDVVTEVILPLATQV